MKPKPIIYILLISFNWFSCVQNSDKLLKPDETRFTKVILADHLDEPMQMEVLSDGKVLIAERRGRLKLYDPNSGIVTTVAEIDVRHSRLLENGKRVETEDGLQGVLLDPGYENNNFIYLYYAPLEGSPRNILARFQWEGEKLDLSTQKILLEIPVDGDVCCHVGGGMTFDNNGNLFLSTGENAQAEDGFSTLDERPGRINYDSQKSSGNTNDLRGKILRIHPEPDGSYSIPEGNLFPIGMPKTRPEIYTMGNRNPFRLSIDSKTNWLYWGEVGPGGGIDSIGRGPRAYDEFNQAQKPGNYGYPYFIGNNLAYWEYDYDTRTSGKQFDPLRPVNNSPNNTGLIELPPARSAFIWYPYVVSDSFPELGTGSSSAVGGPIYHRSDFDAPRRAFPAYYENKWFITDWVRGWIMTVIFDEQGNYKALERFLPEVHLVGPIDMEFGPDGDLYILEYGTGLFKSNAEARLSRIEYNSGNRKPVVKAAADKMSGELPLTINLSNAGTMDYDNDVLTYQWEINLGNSTVITSSEANPTITLTQAGKYNVTLIAQDPHGGINTDSLVIIAGNTPPEIQFDFQGSNRSFYFPDKTINYLATVNDKEDGKKVDPSNVVVEIHYLPEGFDISELMDKKRNAAASISFDYGKQLIDKSDCRSCHTEKERSLGPSFREIAEKYINDGNAKKYLADKIRSGGSGVWGEMSMPPHTSFSENSMNAIVEYILNTSSYNKPQKFSTKGKYKLTVPPGQGTRGKFIFRASYTDNPVGEAPSISSENIVMLRHPYVSVLNADSLKDAERNILLHEKAEVILKQPGAFMMFRNIDLTSIKQITLEGSILGDPAELPPDAFEIHIDSPTDKQIAVTEYLVLSRDDYKGEDMFTLSADFDGVQGVHDIYIVHSKKRLKEDISVKVQEVRFGD